MALTLYNWEVSRIFNEITRWDSSSFFVCFVFLFLSLMYFEEVRTRSVHPEIKI